MTDAYKDKARDIMDNACLPEALIEVDKCLRRDFAAALQEAADKALEQAAVMLETRSETTRLRGGIRELAEKSDGDLTNSAFVAAIRALKSKDSTHD